MGGHQPTEERTVKSAKPCLTQQGLQALNLVKRSTNEPLGAEKEDTGPQTIEQVTVRENRKARKWVLLA